MGKKQNTEHILDRFSANLMSLMQYRNMNQIQLAGHLSTSQSSVSRWMAGTSLPSAEHLFALSLLLECDIQDFFRKKPGITKTPEALASELFSTEDHLKALGRALGYDVTLRKRA